MNIGASSRVTRSFSRSMPPIGLYAEPVAARHFEQWQFIAYTNVSSTSYSLAPHARRPRNAVQTRSEATTDADGAASSESSDSCRDRSNLLSSQGGGRSSSPRWKRARGLGGALVEHLRRPPLQHGGGRAGRRIGRTFRDLWSLCGATSARYPENFVADARGSRRDGWSFSGAARLAVGERVWSERPLFNE